MNAMTGTMEAIIPKLFVPRSSPLLEDINGFMSVEQVLALMGFVSEDGSVGKASVSGDNA